MQKLDYYVIFIPDVFETVPSVPNKPLTKKS